MIQSFEELEASFRERFSKATALTPWRPEVSRAWATSEACPPARAIYLLAEAPGVLADVSAFSRYFGPPPPVLPALPNGDYGLATAWGSGAGFTLFHGSVANFDVQPEIDCVFSLVVVPVREGFAAAVWPAAYPGELAEIFGRAPGAHFEAPAVSIDFKWGV